MKLKTVRRDMLLRRALSGKLYARCNYSMTDDYAGDAANGFGKMDEYKPVHVVRDGERQCDMPHGTYDSHVVMHESDFRTSSGTAYKDMDRGTISLHVHSNLCYTVEIR